MAPEQIEGGDVDGRADVFGMGVLLYECMVGHLPFEGNNPAQVLRRVLDGIYALRRARAAAGRRRSTAGSSTARSRVRPTRLLPERRRHARGVGGGAVKARCVDAAAASSKSYFDDPEAWSSEHEKRLIGGCATLGGDARKRGEAVAAASDYNRALAYAPNDPHLLRIVASMHRAEAARACPSRSPLLLGALLLGTGAFFVARALKGVPPIPDRGATAGSRRVSPVLSGGAARRVGLAARSLRRRCRDARAAVLQRASRPIRRWSRARRPRPLTFASLKPDYGIVMLISTTSRRPIGPSTSGSRSTRSRTGSSSAASATCASRSSTDHPGGRQGRAARD